MNVYSPKFQRKDLQVAYTSLTSRELPFSQRKKAFMFLLKSNKQLAQVVALDYYCEAERMTRFGIENPYAIFSTMLLGVVQRLLRNASREHHQAKAPEYTIILRALRFLGDMDDAQLIAPFLYVTQDPSLLDEAIFALDCFAYDGEPLPALLFEKVVQILRCEEVEKDIRAEALGIFRTAHLLPEEIEELCLQISEQHPPQDSLLPLYAAWVLGATNMAKYRPRLEHLFAIWPEELATRLKWFLQDELNDQEEIDDD